MLNLHRIILMVTKLAHLIIHMTHLESIFWAWRHANKTPEFQGIRGAKGKAQLIAAAAKSAPLLGEIRNSPPSSSIRRLFDDRSDMIGVLVWPYQCAAWGARERLRRMIDHYNDIDELGPPFPIPKNKRLILFDFDELEKGVRIVMDEPQWFIREGGLTLNIFVDDFRAYTLAFSLAHRPNGERGVYIGAMQGRNDDEALDIYRRLTKSFFGIRPRDLLVEILRMFCRYANLTFIEAVADEHRHHRHSYFKGKDSFSIDYNAIWDDRGGVRISETAYELNIDDNRRPLEEIKPKKRSMYRKRYQFLDDIEMQLCQNFTGLTPIAFADR